MLGSDARRLGKEGELSCQFLLSALPPQITACLESVILGRERGFCCSRLVLDLLQIVLYCPECRLCPIFCFLVSPSRWLWSQCVRRKGKERMCLMLPYLFGKWETKKSFCNAIFPIKYNQSVLFSAYLKTKQKPVA